MTVEVSICKRYPEQYEYEIGVPVSKPVEESVGSSADSIGRP